MIALDNGDKIRGDAAVAAEVDYLLFGFVGTTATQLADGQLPNAIGDLYTAGAAGIGVSSIVLVNTAAVDRNVNLYLTPAAGAARRLIPKDYTLPAGASLHTDGVSISMSSEPEAEVDDGEGHITILPESWVAKDQGTWVIVVNGSSYLGWYMQNTTHDDADEISFQVYLAAGTYTLLLLAITRADAGIVDVYVDAAEIASFDLYSVGTVWNVRKVDAGNVIGTAGLKTLKLILDGKHGSSSNHYCPFIYVALWRTA